MPVKTITLILALTFAHFIHADTVKLKLGEQGTEEQTQRPHRGMNTDEVEAMYGKPESKSEAKGEPPISIWHYPGFAVHLCTG